MLNSRGLLSALCFGPQAVGRWFVWNLCSKFVGGMEDERLLHNWAPRRGGGPIVTFIYEVFM